MIKLFVLTLSLVSIAGCRSNAAMEENGSELSSITMELPSKDQITGENLEKLNGYQLKITPTTTACTEPTTVDEKGAYQKVELSASLKKGCDYLLVLELGNLENDQFTKAYFSNVTSASQGKAITAADIAEVADLTVKITLKITQDGVTEGFGVKPADETTNVIIESELEGADGTEEENPTEEVDENDIGWNATSETVKVSDYSVIQGEQEKSLAAVLNESGKKKAVIQVMVVADEGGFCGGCAYQAKEMSTSVASTAQDTAYIVVLSHQTRTLTVAETAAVMESIGSQVTYLRDKDSVFFKAIGDNGSFEPTAILNTQGQGQIVNVHSETIDVVSVLSGL